MTERRVGRGLYRAGRTTVRHAIRAAKKSVKAAAVVAEKAAEASVNTARTVTGYAEKVATDAIDAMDCAGKKITEGDGLTTIRTRDGKCFTVARRQAVKFAGFVRELEDGGYKIDFIGGYANRRIDPRYCRGSRRACMSKHARGHAIDVNQTGRNQVTRPLPVNVTSMAAHHGLCHGAVWNSPDKGHFEICGAAPAKRRYAKVQ